MGYRDDLAAAQARADAATGSLEEERQEHSGDEGRIATLENGRWFLCADVSSESPAESQALHVLSDERREVDLGLIRQCGVRCHVTREVNSRSQSAPDSPED